MQLLGLDVHADDLDGVGFSCLPDCGWCCTHPPEVSDDEARTLRERVPNVNLAFDGERSYVRLQGGCGGCQFLTGDRRCGVYDVRPAHCRWFPFHVYFGRRVEVCVNRSCPGVTPATGTLRDEAARTVVDVDDPEVAEAQDRSREAHDLFREHAEAAGAWGDVDAAVAGVLAHGTGVFSRKVLGDLLGGLTGRALLERTLSAWADPDPTARPYHVDVRPVPGANGDAELARTFQWLVLQARGTRVGVQDLTADGRLRLERVVPLPAWEDPDPECAAALLPHLEALLRRESFAGSVFDAVVENEYDLTVEDTAEVEAADVAAELVVRSRVVQALHPRLDPQEAAWETRRLYDADFLDRPVLGAWL